MDRKLTDGDQTGFSWKGSVTMTKQEISKWKCRWVGILLYAVGKQLSMPLINLERKWMLMMMILESGRPGKDNGLAVEPTSQNPEGPGSSPRLGSRRSLFIGIEHAELLSSTPSLVLCGAWLVTRHWMRTAAWANSAGYQLLGMTNE